MHRRIDGVVYRIVFTKERQVLNGREYLFLVDPDRREIRLGAAFRELLAEGIGMARQAERRRAATAPSAATRNVAGRRFLRVDRPSVPMTVSGSTWYVIPWPWWED